SESVVFPSLGREGTAVIIRSPLYHQDHYSSKCHGSTSQSHALGFACESGSHRLARDLGRRQDHLHIQGHPVFIEELNTHCSFTVSFLVSNADTTNLERCCSS